MKKSNLKGTLILLLTALIWGTAFVAQTSASDLIGAFSFNAYRNFIASAALLLMVVIMAAYNGKKSGQGFKKEFKSGWQIKGGIICGIVLAIAMGLQQSGINAYPPEAAASGRAGFLTAMYVVLVSVVSIIIKKRADVIIVISCVIVAVGLYFLCFSRGIDKLYFGDLLCFLCAVAYTVQILLVDKYAAGDCVKLSLLQFFVAAILSTIMALITEKTVYFTPEVFTLALFPILYLGIMSSGVAYTLQMVGQKYAEPAVASIAMCMESVFAAVSGWIILGERLAGREIIGCVLMFTAVILSQVPELISMKKGKAN